MNIPIRPISVADPDFIAVFISLQFFAIVTFSQIWLLSRPLKALENEMAYFSDGNFEISEYHFNLKGI